MKRKIGDIIRIMILLVALSVLLYPTISNYLYDKNSSQVISSYDGMNDRMEKAEKQKLIEDARKYNEELLRNPDMKNPSSPQRKDYEKWYQSLLNADQSGMMGYISIPAIRVELPIFHGTEEQVLQEGIGHFEGTMLPVGGESTHAVLTGHRGLVSKDLFIDVDKLERGDIFYLQIYDEKLAYKIDQILTVLPDETEALEVETEQDYVTLVSCTPYGINTHRLLIRGRRIPYKQAVVEVSTQPTKAEIPLYIKTLYGGIISILLILLFACLYCLIRRKKKHGGRRNVRKNRHNHH